MKFAMSAILLLTFFAGSASAQELLATNGNVREVPSPAAASTTAFSTPVPAPAILSATITPLPVTAAPPVEFMPAAEGFVILKKQPPVHKFFDVRNSLGLAAMASSLIADAVSTQKGLAYPGFHEMNPIARPFVQTRAGAAAYTAGSFALLSGIAYTAHKTGHHKLEHIFPFAVAGWEAALSARNYHVISKRK